MDRQQQLREESLRAANDPGDLAETRAVMAIMDDLRIGVPELSLRLIADIKDMDHRFQRLTGREAFGYVFYPTPTQTRVVFQDQSVKLSLEEAHSYMRTLLAEAEAGTLRYPFDQELTPEQDLRVINGWGRPVTKRLLEHGE